MFFLVELDKGICKIKCSNICVKTYTYIHLEQNLPHLFIHSMSRKASKSFKPHHKRHLFGMDKNMLKLCYFESHSSSFLLGVYVLCVKRKDKHV